MDLAIAEAELARGSTGDNPWVGCVIVVGEVVVASGHTLGPGEDHAEIVAIARARHDGADLGAATLYSTLEPCAFHGRTPACARAILTAGVRHVVTGILDPNPRVDGEGLRILRDGGASVVADVRADRISRQLAPWVFRFHPHEPARRWRALRASGSSAEEATARLAEHYGVSSEVADAVGRGAAP